MKSFNISFTLDLSPPVHEPFLLKKRDSTSSSTMNSSADRQKILIWPRHESFDARVTHYEVIDLEQLNSIKVCLATGQNSVMSCRLSLRAASAGLRLHTAKAKSLDTRIKITDQPQPGSISIGTLSTDTKYDITIPYSVETDLREIHVRVMTEYTTSSGEFSFSRNASLPTFLPLAINVQDLFKKDMLVSKFTIGTSSAVPVRISSCQLERDSEFEVISPICIGEEKNVSVSQPLSLVSKIYRGLEDTDSKKLAQRKLFLKVQYRCLDQIIYASVEQRFRAALNDSPYRQFQNVLGPTLLSNLRLRVGAQDLEASCLRGVFEMGKFEEWPWTISLAGLPNGDNQRLEKWLQNWHEVRDVVQQVLDMTKHRLGASNDIT